MGVDAAISPRPRAITVERAAGTLTIVWADDHVSTYRLAWLRQVCPCASCNEARRAAQEDPLQLRVGPPPSDQVVDAALVGNYALRLIWADGHDTGIYSFAALRTSCPCPQCNDGEPAGLAPLPPSPSTDVSGKEPS